MCKRMWQRGFTFGLHIRRPECEIVPEELHDERRIFVTFFGERVQLGDGIVEGGFRQTTRAIRRVEDLVVEHGEVKSESQTEKSSQIIISSSAIPVSVVLDTISTLHITMKKIKLLSNR